MSKNPSNLVTVKIGEASRILGVHKDTLRRWEASGKIKVTRNQKGTRLYNISDLVKIAPAPIQTPSTPKTSQHIPHTTTEELLRKTIIPHLRGISVDHDRNPLLPELPEFASLPDQNISEYHKITTKNLFLFAGFCVLILSGLFGAVYLRTAKISSLKQIAQQQKNAEESNVLAATTGPVTVKLNANEWVTRDLTVDGNINGLKLAVATESGTFSISTNEATLSARGSVTLDQDLSTTSSPTFAGLTVNSPINAPSLGGATLTLTGSSNQVVFNYQSSSPGTLTWSPTAAQTITFPNATGTVVLTSATQTLTNKTISGSDNTISNIQSSALSGSYTGITGVGTIGTGTWNGTKIGTGYGGTGLTSYATGDILYASAANTLSKLAVGTAGQSLVVSGGIPAWGTAAASGVTSLDGLTGALTISNTTGSSTTLTIDDATTAAKGIASFSSTNFSVSSGAVSIAADTIGNTQLEYDTGQALTISATPTFVGLNLSSGNLGIGTSATGSTLSINGNEVIGWGTTGVAGPTNGLSVFGNVGIGTTSPTSALDVVGNGNISGTLTVAGSLITTGPQSGFWSRTGTLLSPSTVGDIIATTGNIGVGTTSPSVMLDVIGSTIIAPSSAGVALKVKAAPSGSNNIFEVLNSAGDSTYFAVDSSGKMSSSAFQLTDINNAVVGTAIEGAWTNVGGTAEYDFTYRRTMTVNNNDSSATLPQNYELTVTLSGSTASQIYSNTQSDGDDFRIFYNTTEVARNISSYTSSNITFTFKIQSNIAASGSDANYYIYYDNTTLTCSSCTFTSNQAQFEDADDVSTWSSSHAGFPIEQETTSPAPEEGTGSIQMGATTAQPGTPGTVGTFAEGSKLPAALAYHATHISSIGGNNYVYIIGGANVLSTGLSTVYKASIDSDGNVNSFATTSQGQLPVARMFHSSNLIAIGGTNYVYVVGGDPMSGSCGTSTVYKAQLNTTTGDIGAFSTTSQGQLPANNYTLTTVTANVGGTDYIYALGGMNCSNLSTVYKATINSSGDIGAFDTTSQGQLPTVLRYHSTNTATTGGTTYVYVVGGRGSSLVLSTVYKAQIDTTTGDIGAFSTTSQGQLPASRWYHSSTIATIGGTSYIYVIGGNSSTSSSSTTSTIYKAQIDTTTGDIGAFSTTSQGQLLGLTRNQSTITTNINGTDYFYVLGGANSSSVTQSSLYKTTIDSSGNIGSLAGFSEGPLASNLYYHSAASSVVGGTGYVYTLGGNNGTSAISSVYKSTVSASGDVGTFATTSQAQLLAITQQASTVTAAVSGTNYVYILGGWSGSGTPYSTVYKSQVGATGDLAAFDTTSQGQLGATLYDLSSTTATVGGTTYVYVVGGNNGSANVSTVYKSTVGASGNLSAFDTTSQGQLPQILSKSQAVTASIGGTSYIYVMGGLNGSAQSTVYRAQINTTGDIQAFDTTSQGQLGAVTQDFAALVDSNTYIYTMGGWSGSGTPYSTAYQSTISASGNAGAFATTSQGQLPATLYGLAATSVTLSGVTYGYTLGGHNGTSPNSTVYKTSINPIYTATKTLSTTDLSNRNGIQFKYYSSISGSYMVFEFSEDSGANWNTCTFSVTSTSTWETKTCDISAIANGSKDTVNKIRFRTTDASAAFTSYFDDIWGMATNFSGTTAPAGSSGSATMGASNLAVNAQGTGIVTINYDATNGLAGSGGFAVYDGTTNPFFMVNSAGNVGIGASGPARLNIVGTGTSTALTLLTQGSTGTQGLAVLDNGNVGIGTTNPTSKLNVIGNVGIGTSATGSTLSVNGNGVIGWGTTSMTAPTNGLFVNGNVGIGATTSSNELDVWGNERITGTLTVDSTSTFGGNLTLSGNLLPSVDDTFDLGSNTARWNNLYLGPATVHIGTSTSDEYTLSYDTTNNRLGFNVNGSGPAEIIIDSLGNLGIGTTNPGSSLQVSGNGVFGFGGTTSIAGPSNGLAISGNLGIGTTTANSNLTVVGSANISGSLTVSGNLISTGSQSGFWSRSGTLVAPSTVGDTIATTGNIGVGTTSTSAKLEVLGTGSSTALKIKAAPSGSSNIFEILNNTGTSTYFSIDSTGKMSSSAFQLTDINNAVVGTAITGGWTMNSNTFTYRRTVTVTNNDGSTALPIGHQVTVNLTGSDASDVCSNTRSDRYDVRVAYNSTEIARNVTDGCSSSMDIAFQLQAEIAASGTSSVYYIYYSNSSLASAPTTYSYANQTLDNADDYTVWTSSDAGYALSQETTIKQQGTGSVKAVATAITGSPGDVGAFATTSQGQLPAVRVDGSVNTATIGGTNYIYYIGGSTGFNAISTVYKSTIDGSANLGAFATTSQGQLPANRDSLASAIATIGGTTYVYVLGGQDATPTNQSTVYKSTIGATGDIGAFATTSQGQLPATMKGNTSFTASYSGTTYIYSIGGNSSVYKATINSSGNIQTFATTNQGQLAANIRNHASPTATIGGTTYVYVIGGFNGLSTIYKATIDTSGDIGAFDTTSQAQLPYNLYIASSNIVSISGTNYLYVIGGRDNLGNQKSAVYKATINTTGDIQAFATTSQAQLPQTIQQHSSQIVSVGGVNYLYVLGGNNSSAGYLSTVYKASINTPATYTATKTLSSTDMTPQTVITFDARSTITGSFLAFEFSNDGGSSWNTYNVTISSADTWEAKTYDISGIAGGDKDTVTKIRFRVTDASAGFTMYFDNIVASPSTFTGTSPSTSNGRPVLGASNLAVNAQGTGLVTVNYAAAPAAQAGSSGFAVFDGTTNALFTVAGTGNVGIGTTGAARLNIIGTGTSSALTLLTQDSTGTQGLAVLDNGNVGIGTTNPLASLYVTGNAMIGYTSGAPASLANGLAVSGNVGIGTTNPTSKLNVIGNVGIGTSATGASLQVNGNGVIGWGTASTTAPTNGLFVNGNVGIGASTSSNKLDVWGNARVTGNLTIDGTLSTGSITAPAFKAGNGSASAPSYSFTNLTNAGLWTNGNGLLLTTSGSNTSGISITGAGNIGIGTTSPAGVFQIGSSAAAPVLFISSLTGNVGIGTTGPANTLDVRSSSAGLPAVYGLNSGAGGYGVWGRVTGTSGNKIGIYGDASGTGTNNYAGYFEAAGGTNNWGIYVAAGNVYLGSGNVGIGVSTTTNKLDISGAVAVGTGYAGVFQAPTNGLLVQGNVGIGISSPSYHLDVAGGARFNCGDSTWNSGPVTTCSDIAEVYQSDGSIDVGEIVTIGNEPNIVTKSNTVYQQDIIGVYSTSPGLLVGGQTILGGNPTLGDNKIPVALSGRVPVKVSTENGPINAGDYLTSSTTAGVAMKATRPGQVIGKALEDYTNSDPSQIGKILSFIDLGFADPGNFLASLSLDDQGNMIIPKIRTSSLLLDPSIASASSQLSVNNDQLTMNTDPNYTSPGPNLANNTNNYIDLSGEIASLESRIQNSELRIKELETQIAGVQTATSSATLTEQLGMTQTASSSANQSASESGTLANRSSDTSGTLSPSDTLNLTPPDILLATGSATLANLKVTSEATISGMLTAYEETIQQTFKSLGQTILSKTTIAGDLSVDGTLSFTGNSINSISTLYLQSSPLSSSVDLFNGLVTITSDGQITAQTIKSDKLILSSGILGSSLIPANSSETVVETPAVTERSKVFVTAQTEIDVPLFVSDKIIGQSFKVKTKLPATNDIYFDWSILDSP